MQTEPLPSSVLDQIDVEKEREHLGLNADHALREAQHRIDREAEEQAAQTGFATVVREQKSAAAVAPTQQAVQSLPPQRYAACARTLCVVLCSGSVNLCRGL